MSWMQLFENLGIFGILVGALAFLSKALTSQLLNKELEAFKASLSKETQQHLIRFSRLHADRAIVIKNLYEKLCEMEDSLESFFAPFQPAGDPSMEEKHKIAANATNDFIKFYFRSKIYFPQTICKMIEEMNDIIRKTWIDFAIRPVYKSAYDAVEDKERLKIWMDAWKTIKETVPSIKNELENEFRKLLGVDIL